MEKALISLSNPRPLFLNCLPAISTSMSCQSMQLNSSQSNRLSHSALPSSIRLLVDSSHTLIFWFEVSSSVSCPEGELWGPVLFLELFLPTLSPFPGLQHPSILQTPQSPLLARPFPASDSPLHKYCNRALRNLYSLRKPRLESEWNLLPWVIRGYGWGQLPVLRSLHWRDSHKRPFRCQDCPTGSKPGFHLPQNPPVTFYYS